MIKIVALLFAFHQVSSLKTSYSEVDDLGGSCYPFDTCVSLKEDAEDHLWGNRTCECGTHCIRHRTCCMDSPHVGQSWKAPHLEETCQKLPTFQNAVIMVNKCSGRWRHGHFVREKCESPELYTDDPVMAAPVTSLASNVTYKNTFCALCNYEDQNYLYAWNIRLELPKEGRSLGISGATKQDFFQNPVYDKQKKTWGVVEDDVFLGLKMLHRLPLALRKIVKKCYPDMISQCDPLQSHSYHMQFKCMSYYDPIKITIEQEDGGIEYHHNIQCAMCNGVNISQVSGTNICKLDPEIRKKPNFSFALLLDVSRSDGDFVGMTTLCQDNQKWDPFFQKCRSLVCVLPGRVVKDGKCVPS